MLFTYVSMYSVRGVMFRSKTKTFNNSQLTYGSPKNENDLKAASANQCDFHNTSQSLFSTYGLWKLSKPGVQNGDKFTASDSKRLKTADICDDTLCQSRVTQTVCLWQMVCLSEGSETGQKGKTPDSNWLLDRLRTYSLLIVRDPKHTNKQRRLVNLPASFYQTDFC